LPRRSKADDKTDEECPPSTRVLSKVPICEITFCTVFVTGFEPRDGIVASAAIPTPTKTRISVYGNLAFSERICEISMTATKPVRANSIVETATPELGDLSN
jgi:hypothetical protein